MTRELCGSNGEREGATARRFRTLKGQRSGVLAVVVAVASLTLAACGSVSPNVANVGTTTSTTTASNGSGASGSSAVDFSNCMRSKGVPNYPDPNSAGETPKESAQQLGVSNATFASAQDGCKHLLPDGGNGPSQAEIEAVKELGLKFAQCMRARGVALPDPGSDGRIPDPSTVGLNQGSPKFQSANQACAKYRPPYMPSNAEYDNYARSNG